MKNKIYLFINIIFSIAIYVVNAFYQYHNFNFTLKCIARGLFALLSLINLTYAIKQGINKADLKYPLSMLFGSVFCFLGDAFIHDSFILGVVLFALGHVFYVVGYCMLIPLNKRDIAIGGSFALYVGLFVLVCPLLSFDPIMLKYACVAYAWVLAFMVGKTISNFSKEKSRFNLSLVLGAILFFVSDLCLLICWFWHKDASIVFNWTCMATYYPANVIFAYSIYRHLKIKSAK